MENRIFLERYRLSLGRNSLPVELHRSPAARTFRAQAIETGREVSLTLVSPAPSDPAVLERLEAEAVAAERINQINIPRLYDFGLENNELIYVGEYCEGHTASAWVEARGPLSIAAVLRVALQVVDAMNATAFERLYHPALNPDNIVFVAGQTVEGDWPPIKVLHWFGPAPDFWETGDARAESAARFAAPEQLHEGKIDVRSEIYALGATMWFLLAGAAPLVEAGKLEMARLSGAPKIVRHLLARMLRPDPLERPHDPVALANYLQTCLARVERRAKIERRFGLPVAVQPRVVEPKTRLALPIKPLLVAVVVLALAALAVLFLPLSSSRQSTRGPEETKRLPSSLPKVAVVTKDSLGRINDDGQDLPPDNARPDTSVEVPPEVPRDEMASGAGPAATTAPVTIAESRPREMPPEQPASSVTRSSPTPEAPPPREGPDAVATGPTAEVAANNLPSPDEPAEQNAIGPAAMAETSQPHAAAAIPPPAETPAAAGEKDSKAVVHAASPLRKPKPSLAKHLPARSETESITERSRAPSVRHRKVAKRAQPLPKLRVGSEPAELVGTTRDGKWILSVEDTGRRIIVPPPPGFGQ